VNPTLADRKVEEGNPPPSRPARPSSIPRIDRTYRYGAIPRPYQHERMERMKDGCAQSPKTRGALLLPNETKPAEVLPAVPPGNYH